MAPGVIGKVFAMFPRATARKTRDMLKVEVMSTPAAGKAFKTRKQVKISIPHIRREDATTARKAPGLTATTLI